MSKFREKLEAFYLILKENEFCECTKTVVCQRCISEIEMFGINAHFNRQDYE